MKAEDESSNRLFMSKICYKNYLCPLDTKSLTLWPLVGKAVGNPKFTF